jgi:hypothetical protein
MLTLSLPAVPIRAGEEEVTSDYAISTGEGGSLPASGAPR